MKGYLRLFSWLIVRAMVREKVRTTIAVVGIALGVAAIIAVRMANTSVTETFRVAVDSIAGQASLRVTGTAGRFDELLLRQIRWLDDYGTVSPVIETYCMVADPDSSNHAAPAPTAGADAQLSVRDSHLALVASQATQWSRGELLHLMGVDALRDTWIRRYRLLKTAPDDRGSTPMELLTLLTDPQAIILTERFARRTGRRIGDRITLAFGSTRRELTIRGLLVDDGPARALDGNFALMDIAAAQWACDRLGLLDYADLRLDEGRDPLEALEEIRPRLPEGLSVELPDARFGRTSTMIDAFHFNLSALSCVALLVGLFLIYNTISISVVSRRQEIGILQGLGAGRRLVAALFLTQALLHSAVGTALGLPLGRWLAATAVLATSQTVEIFYVAEVAQRSAGQLALGWPQIALAVGLTLPLSLVAAAAPALEAAKVRPLEAVRGAERLARAFRPPRRHLIIAAALFVVGWLLTRLGPVGGRPLFGFLAVLVLMFGGAFIVPAALWSVCRLTRTRIARLIRSLSVECKLAGASLLGAVSRVSVSVAALAVSLAMMVAIAVMVGSFRDTVVYWLSSTLTADLFVRPTMQTSSVLETKMDRAAVDAIRNHPLVASTECFSFRHVSYGGRRIRMAARDFQEIVDHGAFGFKEPEDPVPAIRAAIGADAVLVSESFSLCFNKHAGDRLELPTSRGTGTFRVAAVYYDYSSNQGTVMMDREAHARHFAEADPSPVPSNMAIYLRPGVDAEAARSRLARELGSTRDLYFSTNENVRREALRIFDSTFTITYALQVIAVVIAASGVVTTLITLIHERKREIALLRLAGATGRQVRRMVLIEAVLVGSVSQLVGIAIGIMLALVLIYVINVQSFGWTIQFHLPLGFLVQSTLLILTASAVCGLYPAARAANLDPLKIAREE